MSNTTHIGMHREHVLWRGEDDLWRDELAIWQAEIDRAIEDVPRLEKALRDHDESLQKHAASVHLHEQRCAMHEHDLANYEQGESPQELVKLAQTHQEEAEHRAERRRMHEEVKQRQHVLMAKWRLLLKALLEAEASESSRPPK